MTTKQIAVFLYWDWEDHLLWHSTKYLGLHTNDSDLIGSAFVTEGIFAVSSPENYKDKKFGDVPHREVWEVAARARGAHARSSDADYQTMANLASYAAN